MKCRICLSISAMDRSFEKMVSELGKYAQVDVVGLEGYSLEGYDIFIGKKLSREILGTADKLKVIFAYKTGVDDFPLAQLKEKGIVVVNSHIDADYIAEYAFGLSVSLLNRITEADRKLRKGIWSDKENPYWRSIFGIKVGLLGYGHIGKQIHGILERNHIEAYTIDRKKEYQHIYLVSDLKELCEKTDLMIVSLPKTEETDAIFNEETFKFMKGKYLVNVGRGNCIDQEALYKALREKWLGGAAIDTWDHKPTSADDLLAPSKYPLEDLDNIILSPHQAMKVSDGHDRYVMDILEKVCDYMNHGKLTDVVDLEKGY